MRRPGQVLSRYQLLEHAWDYAYENRSNVVDVYIRYLREKVDRPFGCDSSSRPCEGRAIASERRSAVSRLPIRVRLALAFALVMAVVFAAVGAVLYVRLGDTLDERIADTLEARTTALASTFDVTSPVVAGEEGLAQVLEADGSVVAGSSGAAERRCSRPSSWNARATARVVDTEICGVDFRLQATTRRRSHRGRRRAARRSRRSARRPAHAAARRIAHRASRLVRYRLHRRGGGTAACRGHAAPRDRDHGGHARAPTPAPNARDEVYRLGITLNEMLDRLGRGSRARTPVRRRCEPRAAHAARVASQPSSSSPRADRALPRSSRTPFVPPVRRSSGSSASPRICSTLARADDGLLPLSSDRHGARAVLDAVAKRDGSVEVSVAPADLTLGAIGSVSSRRSGTSSTTRSGMDRAPCSSRREQRTVGCLACHRRGQRFPSRVSPARVRAFSRADAARAGGGRGSGWQSSTRSLARTVGTRWPRTGTTAGPRSRS